MRYEWCRFALAKLVISPYSEFMVIHKQTPSMDLSLPTELAKALITKNKQRRNA